MAFLTRVLPQFKSRTTRRTPHCSLRLTDLDGLTDLDEATTATLKASRVLFARVLFLKNIIPSGRNHRDLHLQRHPAHSRISAGRLRCPSRVLLKKREGSIVLSPGAFAFAFHLGFVC